MGRLDWILREPERKFVFLYIVNGHFVPGGYGSLTTYLKFTLRFP